MKDVFSFAHIWKLARMPWIVERSASPGLQSSFVRLSSASPADYQRVQLEHRELASKNRRASSARSAAYADLEATIAAQTIIEMGNCRPRETLDWRPGQDSNL